MLVFRSVELHACRLECVLRQIMPMQFGVLDQAVKVLPHVHWWIKADGVDVVSGLCDGQWSGDVDLNDGSLQKLFEEYTYWLEFIAELGLVRMDVHQIETDLVLLEINLKDDLDYLCNDICLYDIHV